jgi:hypothetical protein
MPSQTSDAPPRILKIKKEIKALSIIRQLKVKGALNPGHFDQHINDQQFRSENPLSSVVKS